MVSGYAIMKPSHRGHQNLQQMAGIDAVLIFKFADAPA